MTPTLTFSLSRPSFGPGGIRCFQRKTTLPLEVWHALAGYMQANAIRDPNIALQSLITNATKE